MLVNLRAEMVRYGITQSDIAEALGLSRRAVSSRICETVPITIFELTVIRDIFFPDYSLDYLFDSKPRFAVPVQKAGMAGALLIR